MHANECMFCVLESALLWFWNHFQIDGNQFNGAKKWFKFQQFYFPVQSMPSINQTCVLKVR